MTGRAFFEINDDGARIHVKATPGAARNEIIGVKEDSDGKLRLAVKVTAPPDKGKANAAIVKLLASVLEAPKSSVSVVNGETSRLKTILVKEQRPKLESRLAALTYDP